MIKHISKMNKLTQIFTIVMACFSVGEENAQKKCSVRKLLRLYSDEAAAPFVLFTERLMQRCTSGFLPE